MTAAAALTFAAAVLAVLGLAELFGSLPGRGGVPAGAGRGTGPQGGSPTGSRRRPRVVYLLASLGRRLRPAVGRAPADLPARIVAAGRPGGLGVREVMAAKLAAAVGGGLLSAVVSAAAPGRLGVVLLIAGPAAGFLAPDLWLARRAAERARRARSELPALLDLLRVSVEAGSSLPKALHEVGARSRGPLAAEWRAIGGEVALGIPLDAALRGMAGRLPLPEVRALVAALERARRHGAPPAGTLASQARDARFALARHAREEAARAGPKIQLVVALLLVPSVLLLVAAALVAALLDGGGAALPLR
jgi:tight adherence protein C